MYLCLVVKITGIVFKRRIVQHYHCVVFDAGQQDDARMCLALALTSAKLGAHVANHVEVVGLLKQTNEKGEEVVCGAKLKERFTGLLRP